MDDNEKVPVDFGNGRVTWVSKGSIFASIFDAPGTQRRRMTEFGTPQMDWSLGVFGDLLWVALPESRRAIYDMVRCDIEQALEYGDELTPLTAGSFAEDAFFYPVLQPALENYPKTKDLLTRCCDILMQIVALKPHLEALYDTVCFTIFDRLADTQYMRIIDEVNPALAEIIRSEDRY